MEHSGKRTFLYNFKTRVTLVLILGMVFVTALNNFLVYQFDLMSRFEQLRNSLMTIAQTATLAVDAHEIQKIPLTREGVQSPAYREVASKFKSFLTMNPAIQYIYLLTPTRTPARLQFLIDMESLKHEPRRQRNPARPGDFYDASEYPEMIRGFIGPSADRELYTDAWGVTLSGYAPIRDASGRSVAILGIDMTADDVAALRREVWRRGLIVFLGGLIFCGFLGILLAGSVSNAVHRITEGTRQISAGNLEHRVDVRSGGEIGELADSFNQMAAHLAESRQRLQDYFFRITQSLVHALEAKDPYTEGHSRRVAEFSYRTALELGMSKEKAELVRHAAVLHDIGKLMIHENILTKKEKLEPAEWEALRAHPVTGEKILKPVLEEEWLRVIRSHHERVDGTGYPDGLKGDEIDLPTQIVSITDAYDAMTTARSYRLPIPREAAIAELRRVSGTQFRPEVVTAFLKVLRESDGPGAHV